jgi:hypothetical protein
VRAAYDCRQPCRSDEQDVRGSENLISVQVFIFWHRLGPKSSLPPGMNDQLIYFFAGAYELKGILSLVERNARRKAVELLLRTSRDGIPS